MWTSSPGGGGCRGGLLRWQAGVLYCVFSNAAILPSFRCVAGLDRGAHEFKPPKLACEPPSALPWVIFNSNLNIVDGIHFGMVFSAIRMIVNLHRKTLLAYESTAGVLQPFDAISLTAPRQATANLI
jgi:hypothetical protein